MGRQGSFSGAGHPIEPAARAALLQGQIGFLPMRLEQTGRLHPTQRLVQGAMSGELVGLSDVLHSFRHSEAVEFVCSNAAKVETCGKNCLFDL